MTKKSASHIEGKTLVVTGAASGFGRIICQKSAALGANVVAGDVDEVGLAETADLVKSAGGRIEVTTTDVTQLAQLQALADVAIQTFGGVDVMINNAGTMPLALYTDHSTAAAAWDRCIDINIKGVLHGIMVVHDQMIAQGHGHIVNLSSIYGNFPVAGAGVYGATKAAVNFLSEALRVESQGKIKVTTIKPTGVPGTNLGSGIVNPQAIVGILGQNAPSYLQQLEAYAGGELPQEYADANNIEYYALDPEHLVAQIIYAINQPWGVSISDITVRASGDGYIL